MTTSAVSQQLSRLEREVGQRLLERHGRGIRLTDVGDLLAEHAGRLLKQVELVETDLAGLVGGCAGLLRHRGRRAREREEGDQDREQRCEQRCQLPSARCCPGRRMCLAQSTSKMRNRRPQDESASAET